MFKKLVLPACVLCLIFGLTACEKLGSVPGEITLPIQQSRSLDSIPLEYGELIAVTSVAGREYLAVLWFQRADKSIAAVQLNFAKGYMEPEVLTVPRN